MRRSVAEVATAKKRDRDPGQPAPAAGDQAPGPGPSGPRPESRGPGPRGAHPAGGHRRRAHRPRDPARPDRRPAGEAGRDLRAPPGPGRGVPHPEGDPEGDLHRRPGADQDRGGRRRHLGVHERRRRDHAACPGQDLPDAGARRRHRRAAGVRRPHGPDLEHRRHPGQAEQGRAPRHRSTASSPPSRPSWRSSRLPSCPRPVPQLVPQATRRAWRRRPPRRPAPSIHNPERSTTRGESLMAIDRRIPADHGLTVRMFITGLLHGPSLSPSSSASSSPSSTASS